MHACSRQRFRIGSQSDPRAEGQAYHLYDDGVAGKQRCSQGIEDIVEGIVPGNNGSHLQALAPGEHMPLDDSPMSSEREHVASPR